MIDNKDIKCSEGKSELGASMLEYALIAALVATVCIAVLTLAGRQACTSLSRVASSLSVANN